MLYLLIRSTFFDAVFSDRLKNSSIFHFCKLHTRSRLAWHLKRHNLKDLQSTPHGKIKVILDLQSVSMRVKELTQYIYIYIYIYIIIATWQQSYGNAMVTTSDYKAKHLPSLSVTGFLFNQKEFFLFILYDKPMLKHM